MSSCDSDADRHSPRSNERKRKHDGRQPAESKKQVLARLRSNCVDESDASADPESCADADSDHEAPAARTSKPKLKWTLFDTAVLLLHVLRAHVWVPHVTSVGCHQRDLLFACGVVCWVCLVGANLSWVLLVLLLVCSWCHLLLLVRAHLWVSAVRMHRQQSPCPFTLLVRAADRLGPGRVLHGRLCL